MMISLKPASSDPYIGVNLNNFVIEKKIGKGGMGSVYQARHLHLKKYIAIKILCPSFSEVQEIEQFFEEAKIGSTLKHDNVIKIYNSGRLGTIYYISMELLLGRNLAALVDEKRRLTLDHTLWIMKSLLDGLGYIHENKIVHADIKPNNIIITWDGRIKLFDFGLAHSSNQNDTSLGYILGTPAYMSPEQCYFKSVDIRTDIYSLGITFYNLLSGDLPYQGDNTYDILNQHTQKEEAKSLQMLKNISLPPKICSIIQKMMAKRVEDRYQTLDEVRKDLAPFLAKLEYYPESYNIFDAITLHPGFEDVESEIKVSEKQQQTSITKKIKLDKPLSYMKTEESSCPNKRITSKIRMEASSLFVRSK